MSGLVHICCSFGGFPSHGIKGNGEKFVNACRRELKQVSAKDGLPHVRVAKGLLTGLPGNDKFIVLNHGDYR